MKLVSIFFKTSESIFENYLKDRNKRVKTYQVHLDIFLREQKYLRDLSQR